MPISKIRKPHLPIGLNISNTLYRADVPSKKWFRIVFREDPIEISQQQRNNQRGPGNRNDVVLGGGGERSPVVVVPTNWPASWNHLGASTKAERSGRVPGAARWPFPAETISRFLPSFTSSSCAPSSNKVTMYPKDLAAMEKYFLSVLTPVSERFVTQMCR